MRIDLDIPPNHKQQEVIDALNAAVRGRLSSSQSSAGLDETGDFVSKLQGPCSLSGGVVGLLWELRKTKDGTLSALTVEPTDEEAPIFDWQKEVHQLITSVLASVLAESRDTFFRRSYLFYLGSQLDGEYWLPGFRFAPAWPDDPDKYLINAERVVVIDQSIPALDDAHAQAVAEETVHRNAARLTLLLNTALYSMPSAQCWVLEKGEADQPLESKRRQRGYFDHLTSVSKMPRKRELCPLGEYAGDIRATHKIAGQLLSLPAESRRILRGIENAAPEVAQAFDSGARLYHVGKVCGGQFPSVGLAYRVAAVEAICQADGRHAGFSDFVRAHVEFRPDLDRILEALYGEVRSGHFHGGSFPAGEFARQTVFDPFMDEQQIRQMNLDRLCDEITREAMVNWIFQRVPEVSDG